MVEFVEKKRLLLFYCRALRILYFIPAPAFAGVTFLRGDMLRNELWVRKQQPPAMLRAK